MGRKREKRGESETGVWEKRVYRMIRNISTVIILQGIEIEIIQIAQSELKE